MTLAGKSMLDEADMTKLAEFFVQNYKNIDEARRGFQLDFKPDNDPIYNAVVTLENWRISTPAQMEALRTLILSGLKKFELSGDLVNHVPYRLFDAQEFERFAQVVSRVGVFAAFHDSATQNRGPYRTLFQHELIKVLPEGARHGPWND